MYSKKWFTLHLLQVRRIRVDEQIRLHMVDHAAPREGCVRFGSASEHFHRLNAVHCICRPDPLGQIVHLRDAITQFVLIVENDVQKWLDARCNDWLQDQHLWHPWHYGDACDSDCLPLLNAVA